MTLLRRQLRSRRATWIAFCLVVLSVAVPVSVHAQESETILANDVATAQDSAPTSTAIDSQDKEASSAHLQALQTLSALAAAPTQASDPYSQPSSPSILASIVETFLPAPNQRGPIATAVRIVQRLRQQSWTTRTIPSLLGGSSGKGRNRRIDEMRGRGVKIIDLLEYAIELGNIEALYTLGRVSLFPPSVLPINTTRAYHAFEKHARLTGNATSLAMVGFFQGTGFHDVFALGNHDMTAPFESIPLDQSRALLYYTFAAQAGDYGSQMALGYRYWTGIGVNEDCMIALEWYEAAAQQAMKQFLSGPPGGRTLPLTHTKLSDLEGGIYGPGASVASTGLYANRQSLLFERHISAKVGSRHVIKAANARAAGETWEDVLDYYQFNADRGETEFAFRLGKIYYQGSVYPSPGGIASGAEGVGAVTRDYYKARGYFLKIARQLWPIGNQSGKKSNDVNENTIVYAARSACYLGRILLRGEGVQQDFKGARLWFERGAEYNEAECHNGLGIIHRDGLGVKADEIKANNHFSVAAGQDLAEAQVNMGKYFYNKGDISRADTHFDAAIRHGSPFEAFYYIASLHASRAQDPSIPRELSTGSCPIAVSFYKIVAERGCWKEDLLAEAEAHWKTSEERNRGKMASSKPLKISDLNREQQEAILRWFVAAERGYEIAQNNIAWVLDQDKSSFYRARIGKTFSNSTARIALTHWTRSAAQRNVDALIKVGDYYFYGLGINDEPEAVRWEKAAGYYHSAVDTQISALAMWNLGWMYENGIGVTQDFYLAKRYYDLALETNREAYFPVTLSLMKLYIRSLWYELWGGKNKGVSLWRDATEDDHWYLGKAREDRERRLSGRKGELDGGERSGSAPAENIELKGVGPASDEDPVQWARDRRDAESASGDFGPEDYFDAATRERKGDQDEFQETVFLVVLCLVVSGLIYLRGRWVQRRRREERAPDQQPNNGLFPPEGDPARNDWAILR